MTDLYTPKSFFDHAALLRQAFAHCAKFPTAASRRSLGRVSVPVWLIILSDQLLIVALVSRYLTNKLIPRRPLPRRNLTICSPGHHARRDLPVLPPVSRSYPGPQGTSPTLYYAVCRCPSASLTRRSQKLTSRSTCMPNPRR